MSLIKIALNRMTKFLDTLKTNAEKEVFREKVFQGLAKTQELKPTTLLHSAINRRSNFIPGQLIRPEGQMASGIHNYIHHNRTVASKVLGPIKTKQLQTGKELQSHVELGKKIKVQYPRNDGNLERALIGAHESHELVEHAGDVKQMGQTLAKRYRKNIAFKRSLMDERKKYLKTSSVGGHFSNGVLGRDSNLLSRNFHPLEVSGGTGVLRASESEDLLFKKITGKEFGTKVNKQDLIKLRIQSSNKALEKADADRFPNLHKVMHDRDNPTIGYRYFRNRLKPTYSFNYSTNYGNARSLQGQRFLNDVYKQIKLQFPDDNLSNFQSIKNLYESKQFAEKLSKNYISPTSNKKLVKIREASDKEKLMIDRLGAKEYSYSYIDTKNNILNHARRKYGLGNRYTNYRKIELPSLNKMFFKRTNTRNIDNYLAKRRTAVEEYKKISKDMRDVNSTDWYDNLKKLNEIKQRFPNIDRNYRYRY